MKKNNIVTKDKRIKQSIQTNNASYWNYMKGNMEKEMQK